MLRVSQEERKRLEEEFVQCAREQFERMFGPDVQEGLRTFTQREDKAMEASSALGRWMIEHHVTGDELAGGAAAEASCPFCGGPSQGGEEEPSTREVECRTGRVSIQRPPRCCGPCRKRFFPSGP